MTGRSPEKTAAVRDYCVSARAVLAHGLRIHGCEDLCLDEGEYKNMPERREGDDEDDNKRYEGEQVLGDAP